MAEGTFLNSFVMAEKNCMADTNTTTGMHTYNIAEITGDHYPQLTYTDGGTFLTDNDTTQTVNRPMAQDNQRRQDIFALGNLLYFARLLDGEQ